MLLLVLTDGPNHVEPLPPKACLWWKKKIGRRDEQSATSVPSRRLAPKRRGSKEAKKALFWDSSKSPNSMPGLWMKRGNPKTTPPKCSPMFKNGRLDSLGMDQTWKPVWIRPSRQRSEMNPSPRFSGRQRSDDTSSS